MRFTAAALLLAASSALARTDLEGCTYYDSVVNDNGSPYATRVWYVPDSGEICAFLDCGGGRAPPKTTVPGCPLYSGTATYSPSFLEIHASATAGTTYSTDAAETTSKEDHQATITEAATTQATQDNSLTQLPTLSTQIADSGDKTAGTPGSVNTTPASGSNSTAKSTGTASSSAEAVSSTGGAASMPTAGAILGLFAGAAVYAGIM